MEKNTSTRRVSGVRHFNDQNINRNPSRTLSMIPALVREAEYTGEVRTVITRAPGGREVQATGRTINGAPQPTVQRSTKAAKYE